MEELSVRDHLTGLYNRSKLFDSLKATLNQFQRYGYSCCVLLLDLNKFKQINDQYGHIAGDKALSHFASICQSESRCVDTLCRYGGDEFCIIMPNVNVDEAKVYEQRLKKRLSESPFIYEGQMIPLSISVGISTLLPEDINVEAVLNRADENMYRQKYASQNNITIHNSIN
ncbi:GGDEF domain-containing protein [Vibrio hannami]|uniref:GGDEF domain-containing protein n=1 Tax=Vibrio hannami TaxID=2717094 RepID=UPI00240EA064|nr:GGDEF domain-containing protein [Vibrio hannami]MDG3088182.1 GGDEF domain-containing protein [Vibrio hannami]